MLCVFVGVQNLVRGQRTRGSAPFCPACGERELSVAGRAPGETAGGAYGLAGEEWRCGHCGHLAWIKRA